eukprot:1320991-Amphidinium_carterae.1
MDVSTPMELEDGFEVLFTGVAGAATLSGGASTSSKIAKLVGTTSCGVDVAAITSADKPSASLMST